jgi:hypothetical protein
MGHTAFEKDTYQIVPLSGCWGQAEVFARYCAKKLALPQDEFYSQKFD